MSETALSYWIEAFVNPVTEVTEDGAEYSTLLAGECDDDWKYGSD